MKTILAIVAVLLGSMTTLQAQWTTEVLEKAAQGQEIHLEFDFSSVIKINHWEKTEVRAVLSVEETEGWPNPEFTISVDRSASAVSIFMQKEQFEKYWKQQQGNRNNQYCSPPHLTVEVWVPRAADISVKSISGNIETSYDGGELALETVSGDVDIRLPASEGVSLTASTISGDIYSDLTFDLLDGGKGLKQTVGVKLDARLNQGGKNLRLKSISGDILLREL